MGPAGLGCFAGAARAGDTWELPVLPPPCGPTMKGMSSRNERAAERRRTWSAAVVTPGSAKGGLHIGRGPEQRLESLLDLSSRAWLATGRPFPEPLPRSEWPGEIFLLRRG